MTKGFYRSVFRLRIQSVLLIEGGLVVLMAAFASLIPGSADELLFLIGMIGSAFMLQIPLLLLRGPKFIIWDADPDSWDKYYWFFTIAVATQLGLMFERYFG